MSSALPLLIVVVLAVGLFAFNRRTRDRAERTNAVRRERLAPGAQVMTTSGLYATVISVDPVEDAALLSIAPGVEVKWTLAALRGLDEIPPRYRKPGPPPDDEPPPGPPKGGK
jgi:preprotein translocase subunit YajC